MSVQVVRDGSSRADIEAAITALRRKQDRMPAHWADRRAEVGEAIDQLVDDWLATSS